MADSGYVSGAEFHRRGHSLTGLLVAGFEPASTQFESMSAYQTCYSRLNNIHQHDWRLTLGYTAENPQQLSAAMRVSAGL